MCIRDSFKDVDRIVPVTETYKLANRKFHSDPTTVKAGPASIGPDNMTIMAGPCAVETEDQLMLIAKAVKASGATIRRGGAYKPRTSPYSFQGLEEEGLRYMQEAGKETGLATICEVVSREAIEDVYKRQTISTRLPILRSPSSAAESLSRSGIVR